MMWDISDSRDGPKFGWCRSSAEHFAINISSTV